MVGFVLILAAAVTYLSYVAQTDVPRWGADGEHAWDASVGETLGQLAQAAGAGVGSGAPVSGALAAPPEPRGLDVPFLMLARPVPPSGTIGFDSACGGIWANHTTAAGSVADIADGARGCLLFRLDPTYTTATAYRAEFGGLVRVQGERAFVLAGPSLELADAGASYAARLTVVGLDGPTSAVGVDSAAVPINLVPQAAAPDEGYGSNAIGATWVLVSPYADAWQAWFAAQIEAAGFDPALNYACTNADAACLGLPDDQVMVVLNGPSADPATYDVALGIAYARYDVGLG